MSDRAPSLQVIESYDPGATIAADDTFALGEVKNPGVVSAVSFLPEGSSTGDNTNKRTYQVINRGQDGLGTTVVATIDLVTGNDLVAFDEKNATLSVVAGATAVAAGDELAWKSTHAGTGLVDPGGKVRVEIAQS
jgi:hypothetical protein